MSMKISVIGVGVMGEPIARNLLKAGMKVCLYARTAVRCDPLKQAGARVAATAADAIAASEVVVLVVPTHREIDEVFARGEDGDVRAPLNGKTVIVMSTVAPAYSEALAGSVARAGGRYIEAPLSGSRKPAETAQLVVLAASADPADIDAMEPLFSAIGKATVRCGCPPNAMRMKLANNLLLIASFEAISEATHFARGIGADVGQFLDMILAGPLASDVIRTKVPKLLTNDFAQQAPIKHVAKDIGLICGEAQRAGVWTPIAMANRELFARALEADLAEEDAIAILKILRSPASAETAA